MKRNIFNRKERFLPSYKHRRWRRKIVSVLGGIVVLCITCALILPVFAMENPVQTIVCSFSGRKHIENCYNESGVLICEQLENQYSTDCFVTPPAGDIDISESVADLAQDSETDSGAPSGDIAVPESADVSAQDSETGSDEAAGSITIPETAVSEETVQRSLTAITDNVKVTVVFAQGVLPDDTVLKIALIPEDSKEALEYEAYVNRQAREKGLIVTRSLFYDISFADMDGNPLNPEKAVTVTMCFIQPVESVKEELDDEERLGVAHRNEAGQDTVWSVVHISDSKTVKELFQSDTTRIKTDDRNRVSSVTFENDFFSPYGIVSYGTDKVSFDSSEIDAFTDQKEQVVQVNVKKEWEERSKNFPNTVTVDLLRRTDSEEKAEVVYSEKLSSENSWSYSWADLPQKDDTGREYIYSVQEQEVDGFETTYQCDTDTAQDGSQNMVYTIINTPVVYNLQVLKVSSEDESIVLQGAEFSLKVKDASKALNFIEQKNGIYTYTEKREDSTTKLVTGKDGTLTVNGLKEGFYILEETEAPAGYEKMEEPVSVAVTKEKAGKDKTVRLTVEGTPIKYTLPATGGNGVGWLIYSGVLLMGIAARGYIFLFLKKREKGGYRDF